LEIIVSMVILCLVVLGMTSVFVSGKKLIIHTGGRVTASEIGKLFIEPLQSYVRQSDWAAGALKVDKTYCGDAVAGYSPNAFADICPGQNDRTLNNTVFSSRYDVESIAGTDLRRVVTKITWNDPSP